jgi:Family of unknown function (DUF5684)
MDNIMAGLFFLAFIAVFVLAFAGMWKVFEKAGNPGWTSLIPVYNMILLVRMAGKPDIWILYMFIPLANLVFGILVMMDVAKKFGQSAAFGVGMIFLPMIFYPILGFGDARYLGVPNQSIMHAPRTA